ncbi:hypothetical protein G7054_g3451 [Neopestalotiopsis clavispora]|nr:hypothetical protein G7054_g3451 [Neopestalotiopsis clavispora]
MYSRVALGGLMVSAAASATATSMFGKRDSWGPAVSLGPAKQEIISTTTTIYPGKMPSGQEGLLYLWLGISNGTGDLIQSVIGSYPAGQSECSGADADSTWCISSEVYGNTDAGVPNQWVGELTTADVNYENGILLNYTLIDKESYLWLQTMSDAVTGDLLSTFNKTSGPMLGWGTAIECNDDNGSECTGTISEQTWVNSTIILEAADETFIDTLGASNGATYTDMLTTDGGKTWTFAKLTIPAMTSQDDSSSSSDSSSSVTAAAKTSTASKAKTSSHATSVPTASSAAPAQASDATGGFGGFSSSGFPSVPSQTASHQSGRPSQSASPSGGHFGGHRGGGRWFGNGKL